MTNQKKNESISVEFYELKGDITMYGLYKHANGLHFTGIISKDKKILENYVEQKYLTTEFTYASGQKVITTTPFENSNVYIIKPLTEVL